MFTTDDAPPREGCYIYTYSAELLVCWFGAFADALIVYSIEERIIGALEALGGGQRISSRNALIGGKSI
jgi:hypothetical protein